VPIVQFASFVNEIAPQTYWNTFNSPANHRLLRERGVEVGPEGVTPELILNVTRWAMGWLNLPFRPIGEAAAPPDQWQRFVSHAFASNMDAVSAWRFGTANPDMWPVLANLRPAAPVAPVNVFRSRLETLPRVSAGAPQAIQSQAAAAAAVSEPQPQTEPQVQVQKSGSSRRPSPWSVKLGRVINR
jgi:hypothetical protein